MTWSEVAYQPGVYGLSNTYGQVDPEFISFGNGAVLRHTGSLDLIGDLDRIDDNAVAKYEDLGFTHLDHDYTVMLHQGNMILIFHKR